MIVTKEQIREFLTAEERKLTEDLIRRIYESLGHVEDHVLVAALADLPTD